MSKKTQTAAILAHLKSGKTITPMDALNLYGTMRLGARIFDIRAMGYNVTMTLQTVKNRFGQKVSFAQYKLEESGSNTKEIA
jgi:hypothetical protein